MVIKKLPEYIINRLKAGEVVDRPSSILKELVENALDAGARTITVSLKNGGKSYLAVEDDGQGIIVQDMQLLLERYATSKIDNEKDLYDISSYGFRGEALASISEIAKITVISKTADTQIASKLEKRGGEIVNSTVPVPFEHGTQVITEDIFYNVPARLKFLKSTQTEYHHCYNYFVELALAHSDKGFILKKDDKTIFQLNENEGLLIRIQEIFKKDWSKNLINLEFSDDKIQIQGVVGDPHLRFGSAENIRIFVNNRIVHDRIIRRAILDAHRRQISPGEYPFVTIFLQVVSDFVDVNVHPSKLQVKFLDPNRVYQTVYTTVSGALGKNKFSYTGALDSKRGTESSYGKFQPVHSRTSNIRDNTLFIPSSGWNLSNNQSFDQVTGDNVFRNEQLGDYQIVGQLWNSYIVLQSNDALYYIDQHALAERILFEKMKKKIKGDSHSELILESDRKEISIDPEKNSKGRFLKPEILLSPLKFDISNVQELEKKIKELNKLGFDISLLSENKIVIYAVPKIFVIYPVDLEKLLNHTLYLDTINFDHILDGIFATKACKASIKAGHKLSYDQIANLIKDGFENIDGMFVCQHGRPFFIKTHKSEVDKLFDR